jgi:hypothetical protein
MLAQRGAWAVLAPWAKRRLIRRVEAGDRNAISAAWGAWLARPDDNLWQALSHSGGLARGWKSRGPSRVALGERQADYGDLVEAAARSGHPICQIARGRILAQARNQANSRELVNAVCDKVTKPPGAPELAAWCAEHGLAPADPARRAAFFMLTGQHAQYRAADPDGSVLALAYRAAADEERERLRAAMAASGDLDAARVVARTSTSGRRSVTTTEATYLVTQLAARRDWDGLWRLAQDLPLAAAVAAAAVAVADRWQPASRPDQAVFALLAQADPRLIDRSRSALLAPVAIPAVSKDGIVTCSMSPDGRQLAVLTWDTQIDGSALDVIGLPGCAVSEQYDLGRYADRVLHLGDAIIAWVTPAPSRPSGSSVLIRCAAGTAEELFPDEKSPAGRHVRVVTVQPWPGGFVALLAEVSTPSDAWLRFCSSSGQVIRDVRLASIGLPADALLLAADPGSCRLAFCSRVSVRGRLYIVQADPAGEPQLAGSAVHWTDFHAGCFAGPDRLITWTATSIPIVRSWCLDRGTPQLEAQQPAGPVEPGGRLREPVAVRDSAMVAVTGRTTVRLLDADTLETLARIDGVAGLGGSSRPGPQGQLIAAPSGRYLGIHTSDGVSLADLAAVTLACRPLSALTPADAVRAAGLLGDPATAPEARRFLELLAEVLAARLADEVALGVPVTGGGAIPQPDDVGLAEGGEDSA